MFKKLKRWQEEYIDSERSKMGKNYKLYVCKSTRFKEIKQEL